MTDEPEFGYHFDGGGKVMPDERYATDDDIAAALLRHPIFGPTMRGEVKSIRVAPAVGIEPPRP